MDEISVRDTRISVVRDYYITEDDPSFVFFWILYQPIMLFIIILQCILCFILSMVTIFYIPINSYKNNSKLDTGLVLLIVASVLVLIFTFILIYIEVIIIKDIYNYYSSDNSLRLFTIDYTLENPKALFFIIGLFIFNSVIFWLLVISTYYIQDTVGTTDKTVSNISSLTSVPIFINSFIFLLSIIIYWIWYYAFHKKQFRAIPKDSQQYKQLTGMFSSSNVNN